ISSVGASSGIADTRSVSAAWEVAIEKVTARPTTAAKVRLIIEVLRCNSGKSPAIIRAAGSRGASGVTSRERNFGNTKHLAADSITTERFHWRRRGALQR